MSSERNLHALKGKDLGKCYQVYNSPRDRLAQSLPEERRILHSSFWCLKGVSFTLPRGKIQGAAGPLMAQSKWSRGSAAESPGTNINHNPIQQRQ